MIFNNNSINTVRSCTNCMNVLHNINASTEKLEYVFLYKNKTLITFDSKTQSKLIKHFVAQHKYLI